MISSSKPVKILLGICTFRRPKMLEACLASVLRMDVPEGVSLSVAVVDNECADATRHVVEAAGAVFTYLPAPQRGISFARNVLLDHAEAVEPEWIAFIDDDQVVPTDWLARMIESQQRHDSDVIRSAVRYARPDGEVVVPPYPKWKVYKDLPSIGTGGVMFRSQLSRKDGMGLRFDPRFAFSGGEDRFFFLNAHLKGASSIRTPIAIVDEIVVTDREGTGAKFQRNFRQSWTDSYQDMELFGTKIAMKRAVKEYAKGTLRGVGSTISGLIIYPFNRAYALRKLDKTAKRWGRASGAVVGLVSKRLPGGYRSIQGH